MLKLLAIVVLFGAFLLGWPGVAENRQISSRAAGHKPGQNAKIVPPTHIVIDPPLPPSGSPPKPADGQSQNPEKTLPGFERPEWVIVYITALYVLIAWWTLRAIKRQADIAANSQRSWIIANAVGEPDLSGNWILRASCEFEVFGMSPVRAYESKFRFHFVAAKPLSLTGEAIPDLPDPPDYGTPATLADSPGMGAVLSPGGKFWVKPMLENGIAEEAQLQSLKEGKNVLCLYGFIRYRNAFDKSKMRETRFCFTCGKQGSLGKEREQQFIRGGPAGYNEID